MNERPGSETVERETPAKGRQPAHTTDQTAMSADMLDGPARIVQWLIRADAVAQGLAVVAVFLPRSVLRQLAEFAAVELPDAPIVWYFARAMSAMFVFHAVVLWYLAQNLVRLQNFVRFHTLAFLGLGVSLAAISAWERMPVTWLLREAVFVVCYCSAVLILMSRSRVLGGQRFSTGNSSGPGP